MVTFSLTHDKLFRAVKILRRGLDEENLDYIREKIKEDPKKWWVGVHFTWGMWVRNCLRDNGFKDEESPTGNLDDVYVEIVEAVIRGPMVTGEVILR